MLVNKNFIRYTFYELRIENNLSKEEVGRFLNLNKAYPIYFSEDKFTYKNITRKVQINELMIAIKGEEV